ncbi:MAG: ABC transporter permease [Bacteroidia bacterium]|nr:ABC transporter permease [Bacteroidia bacterium]
MYFEIKPREKFNIGLKELLHYSELLYYFIWRDIKVKYKQTVLGFLWAFIQPLVMTFLFTFFIGNIVTQQTQLTIKYPVFAFSGYLLWGIFSNGMSNAANSMVSNSNIIKKIYFPRLIIPIASVFVSLIDFFISSFILIFFIYFYNASVSIYILLFLPLSLLITCLTTMGCGTMLAALNVKYRDIKYVIPFLIQGLFFISPIMYPISISKNFFVQMILKLNPLTGALELMRGSFNGYIIDYSMVLMSFLTSTLIFILGIIYFKSTEEYFADLA